MRILTLLIAICGSALAAQGLRDGDALLSDARLSAELPGATHEFFDGGKSTFSFGEAYSYTYPDGGVALGRYELRPGGTVCTFFVHGFERCDTYVESGERLVLINEEGVRFPVRQVTLGREP
ncbi:MAG: hypothetical protein AAF841_00595 [Pseudomonadota bacterium]